MDTQIQTDRYIDRWILTERQRDRDRWIQTIRQIDGWMERTRYTLPRFNGHMSIQTSTISNVTHVHFVTWSYVCLSTKSVSSPHQSSSACNFLLNSCLSRYLTSINTASETPVAAMRFFPENSCLQSQRSAL